MKEQERNYPQELLELIRWRPDLPVIPMVDSEVVCDEGSARWLGCWGAARIDRYVRGEERIYFYDEEDMLEPLWDALDEEELHSMTVEEALKAYRRLPWTEAIVVNIDSL